VETIDDSIGGHFLHLLHRRPPSEEWVRAPARSRLGDVGPPQVVGSPGPLVRIETLDAA